ncbi:MAG TPA: aconitate hydratase AcnA [Gemmatimonadales bacterium]|nr:aconitate hydratase AcnA [Gemmatimonadales bacterium]
MTPTALNPFGTRSTLRRGDVTATVFRLPELERQGIAQLDRLPFSIRVLLENALRHAGRGLVTEAHVRELARWSPQSGTRDEIPFMPARVVLQDFTGVPCVVDLAAMRDAMARMRGDPDLINPVVPCDLVIDHSVQVDHYGFERAYQMNVDLEMHRNRERYQLLKFAQRAFRNFRVVPPGTGIVHQVNLEYLAPLVQLRTHYGELTAYPDTVVGTDSHTTMINGLGVLGWGVGGIEAEAVMLGQPYFMLIPDVIGMKLTGELPLGTTATDLVLTVTQMLRRKGVVDKFVEFCGPGLSSLSLADRATIANMAPEYGATMGFFPVDAETVRYLERTGRDPELVALVERYCKEQGLFRTDQTPDPGFTDTVELDLATVVPSLAGPRRPQDLVPLGELKRNFIVSLPGLLSANVPAARRELVESTYSRWVGEGGANVTIGDKGAETSAAVAEEAPPEAPPVVKGILDGHDIELHDGAVVIAAITSCTNTSNPSVMIGAGLLAKKAVERGLRSKPWVKTSLAPGSRVVTDYLQGAGLTPCLDTLRFQTVGYGCTTCIGNSGPLPEVVGQLIDEHHLVTAAVLSGNRNFEARIHPSVRANYLASPMLVVAFALAGRVDIDLDREPLGTGGDGKPVFLRDIWPSPQEIREQMAAALKPELFRRRYASVFEGDETWRGLDVPGGSRFAWDPASTYVQEPPFFTALPPDPAPLRDITRARVLAVLGDSVTTDHISPAGSIPKNGPAARYLREHGVEQHDWNTFGSRRGNHEVMMRGTFGNVRIKNALVPDKEGNWTVHFPTGEVISIYDAARRYVADGTPLVILTGKEYGTGSSRDWAAKGPALLGVKAVIAESYERIHRSNLVGMGVLPLAYEPGTTRATLGLTGREKYAISGIADGLAPGGRVRVTATDEQGKVTAFGAVVRLNSKVELEYYRHGGILQRVLRQFLREGLRT